MAENAYELSIRDAPELHSAVYTARGENLAIGAKRDLSRNFGMSIERALETSSQGRRLRGS
jgi:hypothetical protein